MPKQETVSILIRDAVIKNPKLSMKALLEEFEKRLCSEEYPYAALVFRDHVIVKTEHKEKTVAYLNCLAEEWEAYEGQFDGEWDFVRSF